MANSRYKEVLIHPAFISFVLCLIVILFLPPYFNRYIIKDIAEISNPVGTGFIYSDLDSDGNSELISCDMNDTERTKIIVFSNNDKVLDQYNIRFQPFEIRNIITEDYNSDGNKEVFVFTYNYDSIFLNIIDPVKSHKIIVADRFIDYWKKGQFSDNKPFIKFVGFLKSNSKSSNDIVFFITTGYSLQPRNVYKYMIEEDSLVKSPQSGATIRNCILEDINDDRQQEILLDISATGNQPDSFPYNDNYSWLMVLRNDLSFLFPPVRLLKKPSNLFVVPVKQSMESRLLIFLDYFGSENLTSTFQLFDNKGNKLTEKPVSESHYNISQQNFVYRFFRIFPSEDQKTAAFYFLKSSEAEIEEIDINLMPVKKIKIPPINISEPVGIVDADKDGNTEYFFQGRDDKGLIIVRNDFSNPVGIPMNITSHQKYPYYISTVLKTDSKPRVYIQFEEMGKLIQYHKNPLFYFKYFIFAAIYLVILAFLTLLSKIQQYRLVQNQMTEKKIASLQMKAIKNQMDPHFTLNVLNAIGSLYATEKNREKADYIFSKYARLIKQSVISSDQIIVSLGMELDFVKNYIEIEQFRNDYSFKYLINIGEDVDQETRVPRMLIHTFTENAIKYGMKYRDKCGLIKIAVKKSGNKYRITIEDNGPGINQDRRTLSGTGKGLSILNELIDLYFKLEKSKITYSLENIINEENQVTGARANIEFIA